MIETTPLLPDHARHRRHLRRGAWRATVAPVQRPLRRIRLPAHRDGEGRFVASVLRPAKSPKGVEIRAFLRHLLRAIRANWPQTTTLLRADSHYCCPEVLDWCRANGNGIGFIFGVAPTTTLRRHVEALDSRIVVTNLKSGNARTLYQDLSCRRGQAENHIRSACSCTPEPTG